PHEEGRTAPRRGQTTGCGRLGPAFGSEGAAAAGGGGGERGRHAAIGDGVRTDPTEAHPREAASVTPCPDEQAERDDRSERRSQHSDLTAGDGGADLHRCHTADETESVRQEKGPHIG